MSRLMPQSDIVEITGCTQQAAQERKLREKLSENSRQNGDCIEWTASTDGRGYGAFKLHNQRWRAHRVAYELNVAPIPEGLCIIHLCDNKRCINPHHLAAATHEANMADMKMKERAAHGSKHPKAKLSSEDVAKIRELASRGAYHLDLAEQFGVSRPTITKVINGTAYSRD